MAGGTRDSHRGTRVLEKPQPTAFPNQLRAVGLLGILPSPEVGAAAVGWGVLTGGGRVRAPPGRLHPVQISPSFKAELTLPTALSAVFSLRGGSQAPSRHLGPPACGQPRGPISTSSPPPVPSTLKSTYSSSVELTQGLRFPPTSVHGALLTLQESAPGCVLTSNARWAACPNGVQHRLALGGTEEAGEDTWDCFSPHPLRGALQHLVQ